MRKNIFSVIGLILITFSLLNIHKQSRLEFTNYEVSASSISSEEKVITNLFIERVDIRLPVAQTNIVNGNWQIYEDGVSNLKNTNIFYAHNTKDRFGSLHNIKLNHQISLYDQNNHQTNYLVNEILVVHSNEVGVLENNDADTIILYTCTGFADTKRLVVIATKI